MVSFRGAEDSDDEEARGEEGGKRWRKNRRNRILAIPRQGSVGRLAGREAGRNSGGDVPGSGVTMLTGKTRLTAVRRDARNFCHDKNQWNELLLLRGKTTDLLLWKEWNNRCDFYFYRLSTNTFLLRIRPRYVLRVDFSIARRYTFRFPFLHGDHRSIPMRTARYYF